MGEPNDPLLLKQPKACYKWSLPQNTKPMGTSKCQPLEARISHGIVDLVAIEESLEKGSVPGNGDTEICEPYPRKLRNPWIHQR